MDLAGRRILITGANRGLGASFVEAALARRAEVVYAGARNSAAVPGYSDPLRVVPVHLDVTDQDQVEAVARAYPDIDLIVSNAGVPCFESVLGDADPAAFRSAMEVNFFGPLRLMAAFRSTLLRPGTGVIFVLSVAAVALSRSSPIYSASKAAALMLALGVREELRESGATVTVALPGFIDTEMASGLTMPKASPAEVAARSLDGWLAGEATVWPDPFAELVRATVGAPFEGLLAQPRRIMSAVQAAYAAGPQS